MKDWSRTLKYLFEPDAHKALKLIAWGTLLFEWRVKGGQRSLHPDPRPSTPNPNPCHQPSDAKQIVLLYCLDLYRKPPDSGKRQCKEKTLKKDHLIALRGLVVHSEVSNASPLQNPVP